MEAETAEKVEDTAAEAPKTRDITVVHPFTLTLGHDDVRHFKPGIHKDIPLEIADHWFIQDKLAKDSSAPDENVTEDPTALRNQFIQLREDHERAIAEINRLRESHVEADGRTNSLMNQHADAVSKLDTAKAKIQELEGQLVNEKARADAAESLVDESSDSTTKSKKKS